MDQPPTSNRLSRGEGFQQPKVGSQAPGAGPRAEKTAGVVDGRIELPDAREFVRDVLEKRGLRVKKKALHRVIQCACGYQGFAIRRRWRSYCPECGGRLHSPLACYDLPFERVQQYVDRCWLEARSRRFVRSAGNLLARVFAVLFVAWLVFFGPAREQWRFHSLKRGLSAMEVPPGWFDNKRGQPDIAKRRVCVHQLARSGTRGRRVLIRELPGDQPESIRQEIEAALLKEVEPSDVPELESAFSRIPPGDEALALRFVHLAARCGEAGLPLLRKALKEGNENVQIETLKTIAAEGEKALPILYKMLSSGNEKLQIEAAKAIVTIDVNDEQARRFLQDKLEVTVLLDLSSSDPADRSRGVKSARSLGRAARSLVPELIRLLLSDKSNEEMYHIRGIAAETLGNIGDRRATEPLCRALRNDKAFRARRWAARALGNLGDRGTVGALCEALLKDSDTDVRLWAAVSLGRIGDRRALATLVKAVANDNKEAVRAAARRAIAAIQSK